MLEAGVTDRELLDQFVHDRDSLAFQGLVGRHGSAVHRVCRGILKDPHEAEDVFQATFLVLARKAPEIRDPEALGGWLRGVASRIALRSRRRAARRKETEKARAEMSREGPAAAPAERSFDLRDLVGDELDRLPDEYRRPIILCYLDGLTHQEAARRLDWPVGTVKVRLVRGRRLLRERLDRRGVALGAGVFMRLPAIRGAGGLTEPVTESPVRSGSPGNSGGRGAVKPPQSRTRTMAESGSRSGLLRGSPWLWAALTAAVVLLFSSGPVGRVFSGPPTPEVDASALPSNLTDVLNVECR